MVWGKLTNGLSNVWNRSTEPQPQEPPVPHPPPVVPPSGLEEERNPRAKPRKVPAHGKGKPTQIPGPTTVKMADESVKGGNIEPVDESGFWARQEDGSVLVGDPRRHSTLLSHVETKVSTPGKGRGRASPRAVANQKGGTVVPPTRQSLNAPEGTSSGRTSDPQDGAGEGQTREQLEAAGRKTSGPGRLANASTSDLNAISTTSYPTISGIINTGRPLQLSLEQAWAPGRDKLGLSRRGPMKLTLPNKPVVPSLADTGISSFTVQSNPASAETGLSDPRISAPKGPEAPASHDTRRKTWEGEHSGEDTERGQGEPLWSTEREYTFHQCDVGRLRPAI